MFVPETILTALASRRDEIREQVTATPVLSSDPFAEWRRPFRLSRLEALRACLEALAFPPLVEANLGGEPTERQKERSASDE